MINENSKFYINAKKMLDDYVANGGNIDDLGANNKIYRHIKNTKLKDEDGNYIDLETKFSLLGYPRKPKYTDNTEELIKEINEYIAKGGSFHIRRKSLPFYARLQAYSAKLKRQGKNLSYEQIMKDLGYKNYSDTYFRCKGIFELQKYRDKNGFVDSYRKNEKMRAYVLALGETLNLPYYLVVTMLADEKLEKCFMATDYIKYIKTELEQFINENGSLKNLKSKDRKLYYKFAGLMKYYGDGSGMEFEKEDWLDMFDLSYADNNFRKHKQISIDIEPIMHKLQQKFKGKVIKNKDLVGKEYRLILKKAIKFGIPISELFKNYDLTYEGNSVDRLSRMQVEEIPYLQEMKAERDKIMLANGVSINNGNCKEEVLEAKVKACKQVYEAFKDKIYNFTLDEKTNLEDVTNI